MRPSESGAHTVASEPSGPRSGHCLHQGGGAARCLAARGAGCPRSHLSTIVHVPSFVRRFKAVRRFSILKRRTDLLKRRTSLLPTSYPCLRLDPSPPPCGYEPLRDSSAAPPRSSFSSSMLAALRESVAKLAGSVLPALSTPHPPPKFPNHTLGVPMYGQLVLRLLILSAEALHAERLRLSARRGLNF